jgi:hypothetical protein
VLFVPGHDTTAANAMNKVADGLQRMILQHFSVALVRIFGDDL